MVLDGVKVFTVHITRNYGFLKIIDDCDAGKLGFDRINLSEHSSLIDRSQNSPKDSKTSCDYANLDGDY